jgi:putative transposase
MASFKYLAPYMQRGFISNNRIEQYDGEQVTFRYQDGQISEIDLLHPYMKKYHQVVNPKFFLSPCSFYSRNCHFLTVTVIYHTFR